MKRSLLLLYLLVLALSGSVGCVVADDIAPPPLPQSTTIVGCPGCFDSYTGDDKSWSNPSVIAEYKASTLIPSNEVLVVDYFVSRGGFSVTGSVVIYTSANVAVHSVKSVDGKVEGLFNGVKLEKRVASADSLEINAKNAKSIWTQICPIANPDPAHRCSPASLLASVP